MLEALATTDGSKWDAGKAAERHRTRQEQEERGLGGGDLGNASPDTMGQPCACDDNHGHFGLAGVGDLLGCLVLSFGRMVP